MVLDVDANLGLPGPSTARAGVAEPFRATIDNGRITRRDAEIIVLTRLGEFRTDVVATRIGIHSGTPRRARHRTETVLSRLARTELEETSHD